MSNKTPKIINAPNRCILTPKSEANLRESIRNIFKMTIDHPLSEEDEKETIDVLVYDFDRRMASLIPEIMRKIGT